MLDILKKYCEKLSNGYFRLFNPNSINKPFYFNYYAYDEIVDLQIKIEYEMQTDYETVIQFKSVEKLQSFFDCL